MLGDDGKIVQSKPFFSWQRASLWFLWFDEQTLISEPLKSRLLFLSQAPIPKSHCLLLSLKGATTAYKGKSAEMKEIRRIP